MSQVQNPRKWRYTWETLSHLSTLKLFLFNPDIKPATQCKTLKIQLRLEESLLLVTWEEIQDEGFVGNSLKVPIPKVLIQVDSPLDFKATEDHIEVKLVLVLPVDHPLVANFNSVLNLSAEDSAEVSDSFQPLSIDSDVKHLLSGNGLDFYCKNCSFKLTKTPLRSFVEMPSFDWREVADNWFGTCCCSFGGISEKLVKKYASSYSSVQGICLYDATCVVISKDDISGYVFPDCLDRDDKYDHESGLDSKEYVTESGINPQSDHSQGLCCGTDEGDRSSNCDDKPSCIAPDEQLREGTVASLDDDVNGRQSIADTSLCTSLSVLDVSENVGTENGFSTNDHGHCCSHNGPIISSEVQELTNDFKLLRDQKSVLNGSLGNGFMVRTSNLSKDVEWMEFSCSQCSHIVGAYPSMHDGHAPLDGGVRFFKCYISSDLPVAGLGDIFRKHSLERMFANQLIESANEELSFRTAVRDLKTKSPMLQIVLLNTNAWCCSGYCLETGGAAVPISKTNLHAVVKVLFADGSDTTESQSRMLEEWVTEKQAHEVYMLTHQIKELSESLRSAQGRIPFSCSFMPGLTLSSLER
ncbi:hypothetical protein MKW94_029076 [Papaver nudicaule]|uniref:Ubiquitin-conjugating enzyme E2-binding protein n=1 Tax=Papaver nudicaule TaxID=74823 RepID=A0AA41S5Z8_PAPNU|nr:hypothetical protein [Papaver nudicaule]